MPLTGKFTCSRSVGYFDWAHPHDKQACITVNLPHEAPVQRISAEVTIDGQDDDDSQDVSPRDVADAILRHHRGCLYSSRLKETEEALAWIEMHETELELMHFRQRLVAMQEHVEYYERRVRDLTKTVQNLEAALAEEEEEANKS